MDPGGGDDDELRSGQQEQPQQARVPGLEDTEEGEGEGEEVESELQVLKRWWRNEVASPEILPYAAEAVEGVRRQIAEIEDTAAALAGDTRKTLELQLFTMDSDRAKFVLRSYLRCRLKKVDQFFLQIFADADLYECLSPAEQEYCEKTIKMTQQHYEQSVLQRMPSKYDNMIKQSDTSQTADMIPEANLDTFVFCVAKEEIVDIELDPETEDSVTLQPGELHILLYRPIRGLVQSGRLQLL